MRFDVLYEIGDDAEGGEELAEQFIRRFLEDVDGLAHDLTAINHDIDEFSVTATIETEARISEVWFSNADWVVEV